MVTAPAFLDAGFTPDPVRPGYYLVDRRAVPDPRRPGFYLYAPLTAFAQRALDGMGTAFLDRAGPLLPRLVDGLTSQIALTDAALAPTPRGWAQVFDLDTTTLPRLLGRATGTPVPADLDLDQAREYVRSRPSWRRGTPGALRAAAQSVLVGRRQVRVIERDGSPWRLTVRVYAGQYPAGDPALLRRVLEAQKPVGIVLDVEINAGSSYEHMRTQHGPTYTAARAAYPTYAASRTHEPEEGTTP